MDTKALIKQFRDEAYRLLKAADALEGKLDEPARGSFYISHSPDKINTECLSRVISEASMTFAHSPTITTEQTTFSTFGASRTRIQQLKFLIEKHGPLKLNQIIMLGRIPRGTASALVTEKNGFVKDDFGRWKLANP